MRSGLWSTAGFDDKPCPARNWTSTSANARRRLPRVRRPVGSAAVTRSYSDPLAPRAPRKIPELPATGDVVAEDPMSGFCGLVVACTNSAVTLEDRQGKRRNFPLDIGAFLVDGQQVTLVRPASAPAGPAHSASGSRAVAGLKART